MKKRRQRTTLAFGLSGVSMLVTGCNRAQEPVFDVPSFVGLKYDAVAKTLGTPVRVQESDPISSVFEREGYSLTINHLARNGRITEFVLSPEKAVKDEDRAEILRAGTLREGDARYSLAWIEDQGEVFRVSGVRVVPAPKNHQVVVRANSGAALLSIRVLGAPTNQNSVGGSGEVFQTPPPYEQTFSAQTGTVVGVEAAPFRAPGLSVPDSPQTRVEVLVDGKVVAQQEVPSGAALAQFELD